jgi:conjugative relaxase-like TrwC/TraI family protein
MSTVKGPIFNSPKKDSEMLSMASVGSASGSASYFAKDNYYSSEESAEASMWYGAGAEMLGLAPSEGDELAVNGSAEPSELDTKGEGPSPEEVAAPNVGEGESLVDDSTEEARIAGLGADGASADEEPDSKSVAASDHDAVEFDETVANDATEAPGEAQNNQPAPCDAVGIKAAHDGRREPQDGIHDPGNRTAIALNIDVEVDLSKLPALEVDSGVSGSKPEAQKGAVHFPLTNPGGRVDAVTFENILNGILPDGTQVGEPGKRALGMDLTFSAPKSVSVLGLVGGDERLIEANMKAVQSTMRFAEKHFAEGRVKENGSAIPVRTGNLVYALFAHDTSRSLDPQAHVHAVIANMTRMPNGDWRSLHNGQLWRNNTVLGSVYNAALRQNIEKLGYRIELTGRHGSFEIVGVPRQVRDAFSQRREAIMAKAAELGIATHKGLDKVTTATRDPKLNSPDHGALLASWKERAHALGFDPRSTIDAARAALRGPATLIQRGLQIVTGLKTTLESAAEYLRKPDDPLLSSRSAKLGLTVDTRTQMAVASGVRHLDQREAAFGVHQLTKAALDQGLSGVTPEGIARRVSQLIRSEQLVPGVSDRADQQVTMLATAEAIQIERTILANIGQGKGAVEQLIAPDFAAEVLRGAAGDRELNAGQLAAATSIISSGDRIIAVQGIAGAGKSTMLATAARVLEIYCKDVVGLAFQNKMVGDLADGAGIKAQTLASFLMPYERMIVEADRAGLNTARNEMRGSVVIVDEASMVSNKQMASLTTVANLLELDKLVLVGDRQQLLSIDAGKSFAVAQAGGAATSRMDDNLRQRTDEMRTVAALTNRGRASEALSVLGSAVISSRDRIGDASARWLALPTGERDRTMVLTSGRETRGNLNLAIQQGLKAEGSLKGEGTTLTVVEHVDRTREDLRHARNYEPGLYLSLWGDEKSLGLRRGEYRIARFIKGNRVQLERDNKKFIINPKRLNPSRREDRMTMIATKEIKVHEGDKIRWTANDKNRGIHNSALGRVLVIDAKGITIEAGDKSIVRLNSGDPMMRRLDLAYTLNMHMAQGVTTDKAIIVMGSDERFLANQRLFNVGITRARDGVIVITDDQVKLARQLDRTPGDKLSALEATGQLGVDRSSSPQRAAPINLGSILRDALADLPRSSPAPLDRAGTQGGGTAAPPASTLPLLPLPEKAKGLEL